MSTVYLSLVIDDAEVGANLRAKGELLKAAILETVGSLGAQLDDMVRANLSGQVLQERTGQLLDSVTLQAAVYVDQVCGTSVGIDEGQPSWIVGMTHEYGGTDWYDIYPVNAQALAFLGVGGGVDGMVFAKHVHHPPAEERSFLRSALTELTDKIYADLTETLNRVIAA